MTDVAIRLRLTLIDPVPGVRYALQHNRNGVVEAVTADAAPLSFDVPVRLRADGRLTGPFVRREGAVRRFVYIGIGKHAGDATSCWDRRAKVDVHNIPPALLDRARNGALPELRLPGRGKDGSPACATLRSAEGWRIA